MDYQEAVAYLDAHIGMGMEPGLDRIEGLLDMMGHPEEGYPVIHIAGTNGKTSTARMASLLLVAHGLTTGTFISPHLQRIEERIAVNGEGATPEQFALAVSDVAAFADIYEQRHGPSLTYFELTAAMAFAFFAEQAVEAAVVEVGLGGRLDATNAVHGDVAVLTGVGLDHTEYLGSTVEQIAGEKLAIVEESSSLVVGPVVEEVAKLARRKAAEKGATIHEYGKAFGVEEAVRAVGGWQLEVSGIHGVYQDIYLPLHGRHQTINLAVAIAATEALLSRELDHKAVATAASVMSSPGRMEPLGSDPLILLDGAHNPDGFAALEASLAEEFPTTRWVLLVGTMQEKDLARMVPQLEGRVKAIVATGIDSPRARSSSDLAAQLGGLMEVPVEAVEERQAALSRARAMVGEGEGLLVAGSLYLVGEVRSLLLGEPAAQRNER